MKSNENLVWIDLEMTGLDPDKDVILEIATVVTDSNLVIIQEGPSFILHCPAQLLGAMNDWVRDAHTKSGLLQAAQVSTITAEEACWKTLDFIKQYCEPQTALLCGNSIWQDRAFLWRYMRPIIDYLHYRMIDVTSIKELVTRWYPNDPQVAHVDQVLKKENHRALDDIKESIEELRHYRTFFFV